MRNIFDMAMIVSDSDRPSPKVWQPWYIDDSDGVRKTLPTKVMREHRTRDRLSLPRPPRRTLSPAHTGTSDDEIDVGVNHRPHPLPQVGAYAYAYIENTFEDDNVPLDMSIKRRSPPNAHTPNSPLPPPAHTSSHSHTPPPLQPPPAHTPTSSTSSSPPPYHSWAVRGRPTVITCATPWYLPPAAHTLPPPPPYDVAAAHLREHRRTGHRVDESRTPPAPTPAGPDGGRSSPESGSEAESSWGQVVVQAGPVDPEIDEHFRRSLGRNYQELFVSEPSSDQQHESNDSVDDHFAKALGATWTKLKAETDKGASPPLALAKASPSPHSPSPSALPSLPRGTAGVPSPHPSFSPSQSPMRGVVSSPLSHPVPSGHLSSAPVMPPLRGDSDIASKRTLPRI